MSAPEIPNLLSLRGGPRSRRGGRGALNSGQFPRPGAMDNQADADKRIRDTDNDASLSRLSAVKLGYLDDPFAKEFVVKDPNIRRQPLINRGTYVRTTAIDKLVEAFIAANDGETKQIISLGAGTDTRYWRLREKKLHQQLMYHEIDFPSVSAQKFAAIRSSMALSPKSSSFQTLHNLESNPATHSWGFWKNPEQTEGFLFHPLDLRTMPPAIYNLLPNVPTLLISECCLCYLPVGTAEQVLRNFTQLIPTIGIILYEPTNPTSPFGQTMASNLRARNLYMPTLHAYPNLTTQYARLSAAGFTTAQNGADILWLWKNWVSEEEKERISGLEMLDEMEEFELLSKHYTVVWGWRETVGGRAFGGWRSDCKGETAYPPQADGADVPIPSIEEDREMADA